MTPEGYRPHMIRLASLEMYLAIGTVLWGAWVLAWGPNGAIGSAAFADLRDAITVGDLDASVIIGGGGIGIGLAHIIAIVINGHGLRWTPIVRFVAAGINFIFFAFVARSIALAQISSTGVLTYSLIAVACLFLVGQNAPRAWAACKALMRWRVF